MRVEDVVMFAIAVLLATLKMRHDVLRHRRRDDECRLANGFPLRQYGGVKQ